jgi:DNA-binding PadR family transcriptional regulator
MDRDRRLLNLTPLRPVEFQILLSLSAGDRHGYGIIQHARELGESVPDIGTLYRALARMADQGLIEATGERPVGDDDERRNYYRITDAGRRVAKAEARRLAAMTRAARLEGLLEEEAR